MSCCGGGKNRDVNDIEPIAPSKRDRQSAVDVSQRAKVVFLGDAGVEKEDFAHIKGKTSIVNRFIKGEFNTSEAPTIGAAFAAKTHTILGTDRTVRFELWDTAGQERYHSLAPMYYRGCIGAILVYDITSKPTFERAQEWLRELQRNCNTVLVLQFVGCKSDLDNTREVTFEEGKKFAEANDCQFIEVSAKTGENITELFDGVAKSLWARTHSS